ncbi:unnamed protein product [Periconia digitata]|uniref:2-dehydropantoate 2-reductase n=1 Tax=Periconia digitata TaxID=1303443 RepID=A0A9W4XKY5_9PLEO|nr:unnamed protein product [Periconia digitata]
MDPQAKQGIRASEQDEPPSLNDEEESGPPKDTAEFYRAQPIFNRRIHVLGTGNVGKFVAHSLRGIPQDPPPVTLIFHRHEHLTAWEESRKVINLITGGDSVYREGCDVELAFPNPRYHGKEIDQSELRRSDSWPGKSDEPIDSLIVCTKAPNVLSALSPIKHRLHSESIILFLQNGMGTVDEVSREIFPDPATRPYYMVGINSHGLHRAADQFTTVHAGFGLISLGILPHERNRDPTAPYAPILKFAPGRKAEPIEPKNPATPGLSAQEPEPVAAPWTPNQRYLLRTLLRVPVLGATGFSPPDLLQIQLEKLAVNCIINPLTVLLDARNGSILYNYSISRVIRLLLAEISLVIRSLPELQHIPNVEQRFDPGRLETIVVGVAHATKDNISSMLADVRAGRVTEMNYINGWIVRKGEELGIKCFMNYMMVHLVEGKGRMVSAELREGVPFVDGPLDATEIRLKEVTATANEGKGNSESATANARSLENSTGEGPDGKPVAST